jgi:hypothetical protein
MQENEIRRCVNEYFKRDSNNNLLGGFHPPYSAAFASVF